LYQNINSLKPKNLDKWKSTLERADHLQTDVLGLVETCINWNKNTIRQKCNNSVSKQFKKNALVVSRIPNQFNNNVKLLGGCLTSTFNNKVNCIKTIIEDTHQMGRWSGTTYRV
jgi:hypothetical protein